MRSETSRSILGGGLLVACASLAVWAFASQAQVIDTDACQKSCYDVHSDCVDSCSDGNDPVECESSCDEQLQDCLSDCS